MIDPDRIAVRVDRPVREGDYVLYWMISARRARWSPALERAAALAGERGCPLLVLEPLRAGHRWASERICRFVVEGMADNAAAFARAGVRYHAYVERRPGEGRGLLAALAARASAVVTDAYPCFFLPSMVEAAARELAALDRRLEVVDGNGLLPLSRAGRVFTTAASFRRHLHKTLGPYLDRFPAPDPLGPAGGRTPTALPAGIAERWPHAADLIEDPARVARLGVPGPGPVPIRGGARSAARTLDAFLADRLDRYEARNHPDEDASSGLSPHLHFGHLSAHEVVQRVFEREGFSAERLGPVTGSRGGWWGLGAAAEAVLDEIVTWRELGYVYCHEQPRYDAFDTLPPWALETLRQHEADPREHVYGLDPLAHAQTADPVWNAAQRQLRAEGRIHNALRMLWGKRVLGWSRTPAEGWELLVELNNRYAIDGRDPNSYSGIAWTFGRFDRAWGPERPIYGKVRYMSSENTRRKLRMQRWLDRWGTA